MDDAASEDEDAVVAPPPPPSVFHMEEGDEGFIAVAITALDCCQKEVVAAEVAVLAFVAGCC